MFSNTRSFSNFSSRRPIFTTANGSAALDVDAAVLDRLGAGSELPRGRFRVGIGAGLDVLHAPIPRWAVMT